ncbi:MAG: tetratricopeptide repeat protein [Bacteroidetes bacterium]|nr:tetratricopeptide repeat protein [Bacteroidota bacterium]
MKFLFTLLFACFSITLSAQFDTGTSSTQAQQLYQNALGQEKTGNLHQAKQLLKQALHEDPSFIEAMNSLAEVFRNLEMIDSTIYYLKTSLKLYPRGLDAHQNLAAAFQIKGDYEAAINQYHELLDHYPNYPQAYYGMALINYNRRQFPESIQGSEQAIRLFQISNSSVNASDARMLAGQAYMKIGDYPTAIK